MSAQAGTFWTTLPPLAYTASAEEEAVALARSQTENVSARIVFGMASLVWLGLGVLDLSRPHPSSIGFFQIGIGLLNVVSATNLPMRLRRARARTYSLRFDESGIEVSGSRPTEITWSQIQSVDDVDDVFLVKSAWHRPITLPKRLFADRGTALWRALEAQLIGTRMLQRNPDSHTIVNTARSAESLANIPSSC